MGELLYNGLWVAGMVAVALAALTWYPDNKTLKDLSLSMKASSPTAHSVIIVMSKLCAVVLSRAYVIVGWVFKTLASLVGDKVPALLGGVGASRSSEGLSVKGGVQKKQKVGKKKGGKKAAGSKGGVNTNAAGVRLENGQTQNCGNRSSLLSQPIVSSDSSDSSDDDMLPGGGNSKKKKKKSKQQQGKKGLRFIGAVNKFVVDTGERPEQPKACFSIAPPISSGLKVTTEKTVSARFKEGDLVEARYDKGPEWFPGVIKKVREMGNESSTYYTIAYDDGETELGVLQEFVRAKGSGQPSGLLAAQLNTSSESLGMSNDSWLSVSDDDYCDDDNESDTDGWNLVGRAEGEGDWSVLKSDKQVREERLNNPDRLTKEQLAKREANRKKKKKRKELEVQRREMLRKKL